MKKSKLDRPPTKVEVIKRLAVGESQSSIAEEVGLNRSAVNRFAKREDIRPFIEREQMKLVEAVPDAVENVKELVRDMKNIPLKEQKEGTILQGDPRCSKIRGDHAHPNSGTLDPKYL